MGGPVLVGALQLTSRLVDEFAWSRSPSAPPARPAALAADVVKEPTSADQSP